MLEVRQLGGALARGGLSAPFQVFAGGAPGPEIAEAHAELRSRLAPWTAPRVPLPSTGLGADPARGYADGTWDRLQAIRAAIDPDRLLLAQHEG